MKIKDLPTFKAVEAYFQSGNEVKVERATVKAEDWNAFSEVANTAVIVDPSKINDALNKAIQDPDNGHCTTLVDFLNDIGIPTIIVVNGEKVYPLPTVELV